jgi:hypothetical protein
MQVTQVPRFTPQQVAAEFDRSLASSTLARPSWRTTSNLAWWSLRGPTLLKTAGWQEVGVTSKMVALFCERQKIGLTVLYKTLGSSRTT